MGVGEGRRKQAVEQLQACNDAFNHHFGALRLVGNAELLEVAGALARAQFRLYFFLLHDKESFKMLTTLTTWTSPSSRKRSTR